MDELELNKLAAEAAAVDAIANPEPDPVPADPDPYLIPPDQVAEAMPEAEMIAGGLASFAEDRWGVGISEETRKKGAEKIAPLLVKYDFNSPFIRKWKAEIEALMFFGATGYAIYRAKQQADAADGKAEADGGK